MAKRKKRSDDGNEDKQLTDNEVSDSDFETKEKKETTNEKQTKKEQDKEEVLPSGKVIVRSCTRGLLDNKKELKVNCFANVHNGMEKINKLLNQDQLQTFRNTTFGKMIDIGNVQWMTGQLLILIVENHVKKLDGKVYRDRFIFNIGDRLVYFYKREFALITGFKMGGEKPVISTETKGDIWKRFFNSRDNVSRKDIKRAFEEFDNILVDKQPLDKVKLAVLNIISNFLIGNQPSVKCPEKYINMVDNLDLVNEYPWGDEIWEDLLEKVPKWSHNITNSKNDRYGFPGFSFALQIWAFESFPALRRTNVCSIEEDRKGMWPRFLKWSIPKKTCCATLADNIFDNKQFEFKKMCPTEEELQNPMIKAFYADKMPNPVMKKSRLSLVGKRKENPVKADETEITKDGRTDEAKHVQFEAERNQVISDQGHEDMQHQNSEHAGHSGINNLNRMFKRRKGVGNELRESTILRNLMAAVVLQSKKTQKLEKRLEKLEDGMKKLLNGQREQSEMLRSLLRKIDESEEDDSDKRGLDLDNDLHAEEENKMGKKLSPKNKANDYSIAVCATPSFDLHLDDTQDMKETEGVREEDEEQQAGSDGSSQLDKQIDTYDAEPICAQNQDVLIGEEAEAPTQTSINSEELQMHVNTVLSDVIKDLKKTEEIIEEEEEQMVVDRQNESGNDQFQIKDVLIDDKKLLIQVQEKTRVLEEEGDELTRPRRNVRSPERYTPNPTTEMKKKKMQKAMKKREKAESDTCLVQGPFTEDPKEKPCMEDVHKVKIYLAEGLLKKHSSNVQKKYKKKDEELVSCPFGLQL
ncbi:unnamed protein product, partial [Cuscuta epithymum]